MLTPSELAKLAWNVINAASSDPNYARQLPPEQWLELGKFMASVVMLFDDQETDGDPADNHRTGTTPRCNHARH